MDVRNIDIEKLNEEIGERGYANDLWVSLKEIVKPHGIVYGLELEGLSAVRPVLYLHEKPDMSIEDLASYIIDFWESEENVKVIEEIDVLEKLMSKESIMEKVLPRLTPIRNLERIEKSDLIYTHFLDLLVIYYLPVDEITCLKGSGMVTLKRSHLEYAGVNIEDLAKKAIWNMEIEMKYSDMTTLLSNMVPAEMSDEIDTTLVPDMYVFNNTSRQYGAAVMITDMFKQKIEILFGERAVIIPSSVHELIVISGEDGSISDVAQMIKEVNETCVSAEEVLSDHPYVYENGKISIA